MFLQKINMKHHKNTDFLRCGDEELLPAYRCDLSELTKQVKQHNKFYEDSRDNQLLVTIELKYSPQNLDTEGKITPFWRTPLDCLTLERDLSKRLWTQKNMGKVFLPYNSAISRQP